MSRMTRPFGRTGLQVPVVGQGTWNMEREPRLATEALRRGVQLGLTHIDTAEIYGDGEVEKLVGRAIDGLRDDVVLVSKAKPAHATRKGLVEACERSLRRLRTDRLDVYLLHWLSPHPIAETVEAFEMLVADGKIRHWGVSNLDEVKLAEFIAAAEPGHIACNQVMHHLGERAIEHRLAPFCHEHDIAVVGYSPFGAGDFPPRTRQGLRALREAAEAAGATERQVALAFLLEKSGGFTIPKASQAVHVEENAGAASLELTTEAIDRLDRAFPRGRPASGVPLW